MVILLAVLTILVPGSPLYLANFFGSNKQHDGHSLSYWLGALRSPEVEQRRRAIFALGAIGADASDGIRPLAAILLQDPDREVRIQAALALTKMAPASREAVPALAQALSDQEPLVRMNACLALSKLGSEGQAAIPALIAAVKDESNETNLDTFTFTIQQAAAVALGRASSGSEAAVPALTSLLQTSESESLRIMVARALGDVGPAAHSAAPMLVPLLSEPSATLRQSAGEALDKIGVDQAARAALVPAAGSERRLELPESEQTYLWEIEHHGNLLVKHGFGPLADALKKADQPALFKLLADDFQGTESVDPSRVRSSVPYADVERAQDAGHSPRPLSREAFVARLLEFRSVFAQAPPQVKFALMTLSPRKRGSFDGLWEGTAQLRLYGEQTPGAPAEIVVQLRCVLPRPSAETLARPGWLNVADVLGVATAKAPRYLFAEVAAERGLNTAKLFDNWKSERFLAIPGGVYVCDFNRDGILDALVTDVNGCTLYQGLPGGRFEDVTARRGLPTHPTGLLVAAWVDIDGDGWDDLIFDGRIYRNEQGRRFVDYTDRCNLRITSDISGIVVADYDRDGKLDLYLTRAGRQGSRSWLEDKSGDARGNSLFRNLGNWQFEDVTRTSGTKAGRRSAFTAAWLDANNDGWPDLHVANEFGDGVLLINKGDGTFSEHPLAARPADFGTMGVAVGDIDNDGNIDIYCANMYSKAGTRVIGNLAADAYPPQVMEKMRRFVAGSQLHRNRGIERSAKKTSETPAAPAFEQVGPAMHVAAVGWAYGACLADLDNDGFLDIYATAGFVSRNRDEPDG
jgi:HEAT repeat protein